MPQTRRLQPEIAQSEYRTCVLSVQCSTTLSAKKSLVTVLTSVKPRDDIWSMRSGAEVRSDPEWGLAGFAALSSRDEAQLGEGAQRLG